MKIKSHTSKWAMALCAVAVFSFTAAHDAQARLKIVEPPAPFIQPPVITEGTPVTRVRIEPLPPIPAPADGTFTGTVAVD
jgi:hypothetical protein